MDSPEINQFERAYRAWFVLINRAQKRKHITYGELGEALGVHHRAIRYVLGKIQDYCLSEKLPPLTILIVNKSGFPGTGFIAYSVDKLEEGEQLVYSFNWAALPNPFEFASDGKTYDELVTDLANDPSTAPDIMRLVKTRGIAQRLFRDALLEAYQYECCFTGITFESTLEACHIVPWSACKQSERLDVRNGLLLNSLHHKLFDASCLTITDHHKIWFYDTKMVDGDYSVFDKLITVNLHGKKIQLPKAKNLWPNVDYIKTSHSHFKWKGIPSEQ
jgi:putative restriction endonuclease